MSRNHRYADVFIERPKSLSAKSATWSDCKYYNVFKFLVGIAPTRLILFLCSSYGGGTSSRLITRDSGFHDFFERDDEVAADRGF